MNITLTGIDERTPTWAMADLSRMGAELGFLYTATPEGRNRYPSRSWMFSVIPIGAKCALHICGTKAREELKASKLSEIVGLVQRIQVNGSLSINEVEDICALYYTHTIITQHNERNGHLLRDVQAENHAVLIDASGGRGISPASWPQIATWKPVGFAGGLGPDNLATETPRIEAVAKAGAWVDMEGKLRVNDWFSVERAKAAIVAFRTPSPASTQEGREG